MEQQFAVCRVPTFRIEIDQFGKLPEYTSTFYTFSFFESIKSIRLRPETECDKDGKCGADVSFYSCFYIFLDQRRESWQKSRRAALFSLENIRRSLGKTFTSCRKPEKNIT